MQRSFRKPYNVGSIFHPTFLRTWVLQQKLKHFLSQREKKKERKRSDKMIKCKSCLLIKVWKGEMKLPEKIQSQPSLISACLGRNAATKWNKKIFLVTWKTNVRLLFFQRMSHSLLCWFKPRIAPGSTVKVTFYIILSAQTNSNFRSAGSQLLPNYIIGTIAFGKSLYWSQVLVLLKHPL